MAKSEDTKEDSPEQSPLKQRKRTAAVIVRQMVYDEPEPDRARAIP